MLFRINIALVAALMLSFHATLAGGVDADNLKEYGKGIIEDYSDMSESDDIEWLWVAPGVRLADYRFELQSFENLTLFDDSDMMEVFEKTLPRTLKRAGSNDSAAGTLTVDGAVYWVQRASRAKWFIPYAGFHLAQAGVGIEIVFKDKEGEIVAKIRHSGREGDKFDTAATELVDDVAQFVHSH